MVSKKMLALGQKSSVIREIFEYGLLRKKEIGEENVFDFSLGNPSIPSPEKLNKSIIDIVENTPPLQLHGYTSAPGDLSVRKTVAESIRSRFGAEVSFNNIYMTCGAAASLTVSLHALCEENDEVIVLTPFFPEYKVFIEKTGAVMKPVACNDSFRLDFSAIEKAVSERTKAIIVNSPNNPSGVVYPKEDIVTLSKLLQRKEKEFNTDIFILADEPYRELSYGAEVPYIPNHYNNTVVCYSFSKSLSIPGERIGYIFVSPKAKDAELVFDAVKGAGRSLGYVCAPGLFQRAIKECINETANVEAYRKNRDLLYGELTKIGYKSIRPEGAFYLFLKSPEADAAAFCEKAKKYELLLVPSDDFGVKGYARISYCVDYDMIKRSIPAFKALWNEYKEN